MRKKLPIKGFFSDECPNCALKQLEYQPYIFVRDSEENPDGTFTVRGECKICGTCFTIPNYKPKPHQMPKK